MRIENWGEKGSYAPADFWGERERERESIIDAVRWFFLVELRKGSRCRHVDCTTRGWR